MGRHEDADGEGHQPSPSADWRDRMTVRGGPAVHAVARLGWAVFGVIGAVLMSGVAVLYMLYPGEYGGGDPAITNLMAGLIVFLPMGAAAGAAFGLLAQSAARSWLRNPTEAERRAARMAPAPASPFGAHGLRTSGPWARSFDTCAKSVAAYHSVIATVPEGAARTWFTKIGTTLERELAEALRLAKLGESVDTGPDGLGETGRRVAGLLDQAEKSFAETTERAAAIILDLRDEHDFGRVSAQLDMLAEQAPRLRDERG